MLQRGAFPLFVDMRGADWTDPDAFRLVDGARRFENWEFAYALVLGLGEATRYALAVGSAAANGLGRWPPSSASAWRRSPACGCWTVGASAAPSSRSMSAGMMPPT